MISSELARDEILRTANGMLVGQINLIEGSRKISDLRHAIGESENPVFAPIIGFESETDDYPLGPSRELWDPRRLREKDDEIGAYVVLAGPAVLEACKRILEQFGR